MVTVRPIAGTRRRGHSEAEDQALEAELLADPKELAEHLMLIDLGRNDTGRVAQVGTVRVTEQMIVERYSHVMHIVSNVVGDLRPGLTAIDVLRATFPAGTVSGAPRSAPWRSSTSWSRSSAGSTPAPSAICPGTATWIPPSPSAPPSSRTAPCTSRPGAGIVADSVPALEWAETMNKGRAIFRAVALAEAGLDRTTVPVGD